MRLRGFHIFWTVDSQIGGEVSLNRRGKPPGRFLVFISVRGCVDPRAIVRLEGLGQFKNSVTSLGIAPAIFGLLA
jgi:hypothetical protein